MKLINALRFLEAVVTLRRKYDKEREISDTRL